MSTEIVQEVVFGCAPEKVWDALMRSEQHAAFTGAPAEVSTEEGGVVSGYAGQVGGRNVELVRPSRIVQAWRAGSWPAGTWSIVRFELVADGQKTRLTMTHSGVPDDAQAMIAQGWQARYWEPLRTWLEA